MGEGRFKMFRSNTKKLFITFKSDRVICPSLFKEGTFRNDAKRVD